jgi:hypothetical protein
MALAVTLLMIGASVVALVVSAAMKAQTPGMAYVHLIMSASVAVVLAVAGIREGRRLSAAGASPPALAASHARHMGLIWALALGATYATRLLVWREWPQFLAAFSLAACLCLFFAGQLTKDAAGGNGDKTMLTISRYLSWAQLAGMGLVMAGLVVDGKMTRFLTPRYGDWAANNIFFFGALGIAVLSAHALRTVPPPAPEDRN